jgi:glycosyltransferase involved in cell wall biosynthesis
MPESVLIVTQEFTYGGLETHILGEIKELTSLGHQVFLLAGKTTPEALERLGIRTYTDTILSSHDISEYEFYHSVDRIRELIHANKITRIHAHPFISLLPSFVAATIEQIAFVATLHGPASLEGFSGPVLSFLLGSIVFPCSSGIVCVSEEIKNLLQPFVDKPRVHTLLNAISINADHSVPDTAIKDSWLIVSRLDELKSPSIIQFIKMAYQMGMKGISLAGDGPYRDQLLAELSSLIEEGYLTYLGKVDDAQSIMPQYEGIAGMGRVALEGMACHKPVILVGYDGTKGIITEGSFVEMQYANFSGRGIPTITENKLSESLLDLKSLKKNDIRSFLKKYHDEKKQWKVFSQLLDGLEPPDENILTDWYRSVVSGLGKANESSIFYSHNFLQSLEKYVCARNRYHPSLEYCYKITRMKMGDSTMPQSSRKIELVPIGSASIDLKNNQDIMISEFKSKLNRLETRIINP